MWSAHSPRSASARPSPQEATRRPTRPRGCPARPLTHHVCCPCPLVLQVINYYGKKVVGLAADKPSATVEAQIRKELNAISA